MDKKGNVTPELKQAAERSEVSMPEGLEAAESVVEKVILRKAQKLEVKDKSKEVEVKRFQGRIPQSSVPGTMGAHPQTYAF